MTFRKVIFEPLGLILPSFASSKPVSDWKNSKNWSIPPNSTKACFFRQFCWHFMVKYTYIKWAIFHKITSEGLIFFSGPIFLVPEKVWTLVDMAHTVGPQRFDRRGPQIGPEGPTKGLKMRKISYFHKITDEGLIFFLWAYFLKVLIHFEHLWTCLVQLPPHSWTLGAPK